VLFLKASTTTLYVRDMPRRQQSSRK